MRTSQELLAGGIHVVERIPVVIKANAHNADYLHTKSSIMGHWLDQK